jgi:TrmH family RNA methyltransferase
MNAELIRPLTEAEAKHIHGLLRSAPARREHAQFVIEGPHLLEVALEQRAPIAYCCFTEDARAHTKLLTAAADAGVGVRSLPAKLARRISDTDAPQGIFGVLRIPKPSSITGDVVLALDAVQDPGNVGTLLRTAAWFGVDTVLLGEGSADAYNPKVVRGTQGAIFMTSVHERVSLTSKLEELKRSGYRVLSTMLDESATPIENIANGGKRVIVLGNEARGISEEIAALSDERLFIPRLGDGESLNVAATGAIVLYHLTKKR